MTPSLLPSNLQNIKVRAIEIVGQGLLSFLSNFEVSMHVVLYLDNLFPLPTHKLLFLCICTKVMYDMQPTKNVVHVADFFFFIALGNMLKFSTTKGIIPSLQCWNFLKEELCMMV